MGYKEKERVGPVTLTRSWVMIERKKHGVASEESSMVRNNLFGRGRFAEEGANKAEKDRSSNIQGGGQGRELWRKALRTCSKQS